MSFGQIHDNTRNKVIKCTKITVVTVREATLVLKFIIIVFKYVREGHVIFFVMLILELEDRDIFSSHSTSLHNTASYCDSSSRFELRADCTSRYSQPAAAALL